jgi:hypothetical protein
MLAALVQGRRARGSPAGAIALPALADLTRLTRMYDDLRNPSYFALRACPGADGAQWWASARSAADSAPLAIRALPAGRTRVEVSAEEATAC